jgi:hypothetical protein
VFAFFEALGEPDRLVAFAGCTFATLGDADTALGDAEVLGCSGRAFGGA